MKTAVINYGMGNLASVRRALEDLGADAFIANYPDELFSAHKIILPGVGAFAEGMDRLRKFGWEERIRELINTERSFLGICLGMQMLASKGYEGGDTQGLGLIAGTVERLDASGCKLRIPHVGWNEVKVIKDHKIFYKIPDSSDFYFVHSYSFRESDRLDRVASVGYGAELSAVVARENVIGCQFHPEKSSKVGRQFLHNFLRL